MKLATSIKGGVRALLAKHNLRLAASDLDGDTGTASMDALELPGTNGRRLASQRRMLLVLADEIASVEIDLHTRLRHHPGYCNLLKVKGISPILAAVFVAEIGEVTRFPTASALCCWAGLTPRYYESDKTVHRGHISKEGDTLIRWAAVEAIQRQTEPAVKAVKDGIIARRGNNTRSIAKVAAARKMLEVVYYVLRDGQARCLTAAADAA
ncbi:MAG: transposase [Actinomycetes bacterium]